MKNIFCIVVMVVFICGSSYGLQTVHQTPGMGDYTTISDALAAASSGEEVRVIDQGTYNENFTLDDVILTSVPKNAKITDSVTTTGTSDITIQGFTFEGDYIDYNDNTNTGCYITGAASVLIDSCTFEDFATCVWIQAAADVTFIDGYVIGLNTSIRNDVSGTKISLLANTWATWADRIIELNAPTEFYMEDSGLRTGYTGIYIGSSASGSVINLVDSIYRGNFTADIDSYAECSIDVDSCTFEETRGLIINTGSSGSVLNVTGTLFTDSFGHNIEIDDVIDATVENTRMEYTSGDGIHVNANGCTVNVINSDLYRSYESGIQCLKVADVNIQDSTISYSSHSGIWFDNQSIGTYSHLSIDNSLISHNGGTSPIHYGDDHGIQLEYQRVIANITNSIIENNKGSGIYCLDESAGGKDLYVSDSIIRGNTDSAIYMSAYSFYTIYADIQRCILQSKARDFEPVLYLSHLEEGSIVGNNIIEGGDNGIYLYDSNSLVVHNTIVGSVSTESAVKVRRNSYSTDIEVRIYSNILDCTNGIGIDGDGYTDNMTVFVANNVVNSAIALDSIDPWGGMVYKDPMFTKSSDGTIGSGIFTLQDGSPAVGAGSANYVDDVGGIDILGNERPVYYPTCGAYEGVLVEEEPEEELSGISYWELFD